MIKIFYILAQYFSVLWPIGYFKYAPGTLASFIAGLFGYFSNLFYGSDITIILAINLGLLGLLSTKYYLIKQKRKDPSEVVIDEFSGQLIASSMAGTSIFFNVLAFVLFRIFDILKPGIIKKSEKLPGAYGVMLDDFIAGIFSAIIISFFSLLGFVKYNWFLF